MTFEFWLEGETPTELDEYLAKIDDELDALFLEAVEETKHQLAAERAAASDAAA